MRKILLIVQKSIIILKYFYLENLLSKYIRIFMISLSKFNQRQKELQICCMYVKRAFKAHILLFPAIKGVINQELHVFATKLHC